MKKPKIGIKPIYFFRFIDIQHYMAGWNISTSDAYVCFCYAFEDFCDNFNITEGKFRFFK